MPVHDTHKPWHGLPIAYQVCFSGDNSCVRSAASNITGLFVSSVLHRSTIEMPGQYSRRGNIPLGVCWWPAALLRPPRKNTPIILSRFLRNAFLELPNWFGLLRAVSIKWIFCVHRARLLSMLTKCLHIHAGKIYSYIPIASLYSTK